VGDRLFSWLLDGGDVESWELFERRLGTLGPGAFGDATVAEVRQVALALVDAATANGVRPGPARSVPVDVTLPDGTRVVGIVEDRLEGRPGPARLTYSKIRPAYRLAAWLDLLALTVTAAEVPWRSLGVHQHQGKQPVALVDLDLLAPSDDPPARRAAATAALEVVVDCYRRGSVEPVPLFPSVSHEVWEGRSGESEWIRAGGGGDGAKPPASLVHGGRDFRDLARQPRRPGDPVTRSGPGASRLVCFAEYLWDAFDASVVDTGESSAESDEVMS
jgi:exonuclease V gamma subunit